MAAREHESTETTKSPPVGKARRVRNPHPFARLENPSPWESTRMVFGLCTGLVIARLLLLLVSTAVTVAATVALHSLGCERARVHCLRLGCRWALLVASFVWIPVSGSFSGSSEPGRKGRGQGTARIVVSNHLSNIEILHLLTLPFVDGEGNPVLPCFVTKASVFGVPLIGTVARDVLGCIGVERRTKKANADADVNVNVNANTTNANANANTNANVREQQQSAAAAATTTTTTTTARTATEQILERVRAQSDPATKTTKTRGPIVVFPEGTTTNGTCLLAFKQGAFAPMVEVLPIVYSFRKNGRLPQEDPDPKTPSSFLPTYESIWGPAYLWRLLSQPVHHLHCSVLEPVRPGGRGPEAFGENTRSTMADALGGLPLVPARYDYRHKLAYHRELMEAYKAHPSGPVWAMCFAPVEKVLHKIPGEDDGDPRPGEGRGYDTVEGRLPGPRTPCEGHQKEA